MTAQYKRNKLRSSGSTLLKRFSRFALFALVLVLIPIVAFFVITGSNPNRFTGVVESDSETVGSVDSSRIISIDVFPGQKVKPGDVLVRLEPTDRAMDLAMNEARLMDYEQSLLRYRETQLQHLQGLQESSRKYRQLVEEAAVELEQEKMNKTRDLAELKGLQVEIKRLQPLVEKRVVSEVELASIRPRITTLELTVTQYDPLINALQSRLEKAKEGLDEVVTLQERVNAETKKNPIELSLQKARQACEKLSSVELSILRATRTGVVSRIQHQTGDVVSAGDPIVRITSESSMYIIGMLPQGVHEAVNVGDRLAVSRTTPQHINEILTAEVETLDPEVMDLIDPFNPSPRIPIPGRRVRLRIVNKEHTLVPGETVYLQSAIDETLINSIKRCFKSSSGIKQQLLFTTSR